MTQEEVAINIANHDIRISQVEQRCENMEKSQKQLVDLTISVKDLSHGIKTLNTGMETLVQRVTDIEKEPAENWKNLKKTVTACVITGFVGAIVGAIITLL